MIAVRPSPRGGPGGRGVFATRPIREGDLIEESHVIVVPSSQWEHLDATILGNYCFGWGEGFEDAAVALGTGSLYNHDDDPNARFERDFGAAKIRFYAKHEIATGEEITISYRTAFPDEPLPFDS